MVSISMQYCSALKKMETVSLVDTWANTKDTVLSEITLAHVYVDSTRVEFL